MNLYMFCPMQSTSKCIHIQANEMGNYIVFPAFLQKSYNHQGWKGPLRSSTINLPAHEITFI